MTAPGQLDYAYQGAQYKTVGKYPVHLTEVSVAGDVIGWTYDGQIHAVRVAELQ
jgi:hypothetical protein